MVHFFSKWTFIFPLTLLYRSHFSICLHFWTFFFIARSHLLVIWWSWKAAGVNKSLFLKNLIEIIWCSVLIFSKCFNPEPLQYPANSPWLSFARLPKLAYLLIVLPLVKFNTIFFWVCELNWWCEAVVKKLKATVC